VLDILLLVAVVVAVVAAAGSAATIDTAPRTPPAAKNDDVTITRATRRLPCRPPRQRTVTGVLTARLFVLRGAEVAGDPRIAVVTVVLLVTTTGTTTTAAAAAVTTATIATIAATTTPASAPAPACACPRGGATATTPLAIAFASGAAPPRPWLRRGTLARRRLRRATPAFGLASRLTAATVPLRRAGRHAIRNARGAVPVT
jgi:hypothetical protein